MLADQLNVLMRLMQAKKKIVMDKIRKIVTTSIVYIYQVVHFHFIPSDDAACIQKKRTSTTCYKCRVVYTTCLL